MSNQPKIESIGEIVNNIREDIVSRGEGDNRKYATGLSGVDDVIVSLRKKRLYVVGGRSGTGKTTFLCNLAFNLADKTTKVFFFSLEMSKEEIVQRLVCLEEGISYKNFELDYLNDILARDLEKFKEITKNHQLIVVDSFGYEFNLLSNFIKKLQPKPDIIFIDHIQMASSKGYKSKYEAISEYIRKLKELAMTENIVIVVASQINRAGGKGTPELMHLKESGTIEETADCVFLCHWPYSQSESENIKEYYILIAKNRFGRVKPKEGVKIAFEPSIYLMRDWMLTDNHG